MVRSGWKSSKPELKDEDEDARVKVEAEAELGGKRVEEEEVEDTMDTSSPSVFELAGKSEEEKEDILPRILYSLIRIYTHNGTVVLWLKVKGHLLTSLSALPGFQGVRKPKPRNLEAKRSQIFKLLDDDPLPP